MPAADPQASEHEHQLAMHQVVERLFKAQDADAVAVACHTYLTSMVEGAQTAWCKKGERSDSPHARMLASDPRQGRVLEVQLPESIDPEPLAAHLDWLGRIAGMRLRQQDETVHLYDAVSRLAQAERLQRALYAIADQARTDRDMNEVMRSLHGIVGSLMYAENFYIALYDRRRKRIRFAYFADTTDTDGPGSNESMPLDAIRNTLTWYLIRDGRPMMGGMDKLATQVDGPLTPTGPTCVDWLGVPMLRGGEVVGGLVVQSYREEARYTGQDQELLGYVAQHVQTALERREAHADLERRVNERTEALREANRVLQQQVLERQRGERLQAALFRIAELANTTESIDEFYAAVHRVIGGLIYSRNFYLALKEEDREELSFPYSVDEFDSFRKPRALGHGLTEYVLRHGKPLLVGHDDIQRMVGQGDLVQSGATSHCWLGVPLVCDDQVNGVLAVQSYSPEHQYTSRDQELLTFVSYHIANALQRKRSAESLKQAYAGLERRVNERTRALALANRDLREQIAERERVERRLKYETLHDSLTGLPNRALLLQRLEHALQRYHTDRRQMFAVLFIDLDRFKVINDSVGHLIGDDLLFQVGGRIRACLKTRDLVARLGGDEFAVLVEGIGDARSIQRIAERVIGELHTPFRIGAKELFTSASVGIALAAPHYRRAEELLRDADSAMYSAKAGGRHRSEVFDDRLRRNAVSQLEVEGDLRRALTRNEFEPFYQPIVRLADGRILGYEALMRWRHPERGLLAPGEFLTVAEDSGCSEAIDWKIFEHVCKQARSLVGTSGFISINLSGRHFRSPDIDRRLLDLLAEHNVPPKSLRVEVTERTLLENPEQIKRSLDAMRKAGLTIALDDFGTGYSSLSYMHQYPIEVLKVDRSFVIRLSKDADDQGAAIVRAIQALADSLHMQVIAEGIETEAQRVALQRIGCKFGQGFLFSQARPAEHWLAQPHAAGQPPSEPVKAKT
ncbi:EAL domain-containing protein [Oleiagrimonas sp. C23AA]|uniref:putative bifunctional diguanylate cyclase/phosphodiesterase n=1 Tax=Oleiagrimonas sp. C23AA TaxID=2719047 RepID=UPI001F10DB26|nr:EAL domain-containing protein [Oleiagrimonas sp. C23AA]